MGESDPFAVIYVKGEREPRWEMVGRTKTIYNNLSPNFPEAFDINYYFEKNQIIKVEIFDEDEEAPELIGNYSVALNKLLTANN